MYRAVSKKSLIGKTVEEVKAKKRYFIPGIDGDRIPSNIDFFTDNFWELIRRRKYLGYPSRRNSASASTLPKCALASSSADDRVVYRVVLPEKLEKRETKSLAFLINCKDAKYHKDIRVLKSIITQAYYKDETKNKLNSSREFLLSFSPGHNIDYEKLIQEIDKDFQSTIIQMCDAVSIWHDVVCLSEENLKNILDGQKIMNNGSEVWFDQRDGYWLEEI